MSREIRPGAVIVAGEAGGFLDYVLDGEVVYQFLVPPGRHRASLWLDLVEPGYTLEVGEGVVCFLRRAGVFVTQHPDAVKSDANPDFRPTSASRLEREMRVEIAEMRGLRKKMEARQRALDSVQLVEQIPDAQSEAKADAKPEAPSAE